MTSEFKKIKNNEDTHYVLETATSGATSAGAVATAPRKSRKDSILAQEKKETPKPRNFVAKNAKMGGAGKMKDKSKTIPRKEKHKKPVAEGSGDKKPYPNTWHDVDPKLGKQVDKMSPEEKVKKGYSNPSILKKKKEQGVAEGYSLKKTNVNKYMEPGDPDEYTQDINIKDTDYEIINNKTGQVVGTASWTTNDYFGPGALKITMKNGATRWLDIWEREKGNPQTAFNRFVKDPKTAKKYKEQGVAEEKIDFAKKLQKNVDKSNKAVVKTRQDIGSRIADIGAGGKEYNVKTDAAWDAAKKKVAEGSAPKEKQKTPYRDINGPEYKAAADKQKEKMAKDKESEPGKKLADKIDNKKK